MKKETRNSEIIRDVMRSLLENVCYKHTGDLLKKDHVTAFNLMFIEERSLDEISLIMGMPKTAVGQTIAFAIKRLKECIPVHYRRFHSELPEGEDSFADYKRKHNAFKKFVIDELTLLNRATIEMRDLCKGSNLEKHIQKIEKYTQEKERERGNSILVAESLAQARKERIQEYEAIKKEHLGRIEILRMQVDDLEQENKILRTKP